MDYKFFLKRITSIILNPTTGTEEILNPAQHKKMPMVIATTICLLGIYIVTNLVLDKLIDSIYYSFFA